MTINKILKAITMSDTHKLLIVYAKLHNKKMHYKDIYIYIFLIIM